MLQVGKWKVMFYRVLILYTFAIAWSWKATVVNSVHIFRSPTSQVLQFYTSVRIQNCSEFPMHVFTSFYHCLHVVRCSLAFLLFQLPYSFAVPVLQCLNNIISRLAALFICIIPFLFFCGAIRLSVLTMEWHTLLEVTIFVIYCQSAQFFFGSVNYPTCVRD